MKAIIPVAGAGTRLRPFTYTQPKAMIPVAGKPVLGFIIDQLKDVGITDFVFIIGYLGEKIKNYVESDYPEIKSQFVEQKDRQGSGHAIWTAKEKLKADEDAFIIFGDTILLTDLKAVLQSEYSTVCIKKVENPREYGVAEIGEDGFIKALVEKPNIPKSNMGMVGAYYVKNTGKLVEALDHNIKNKIRTNNEYPLTDALMRMIEQGEQFKGAVVDMWYNLGEREVILETNATLLKKYGVMAEEQGSYENTIIIPPVSIGKDTVISNSIVGPNVTIGENSKIDYSIIKESIIGHFTTLEAVNLNGSIIGSDASITGLSHRLNIGDNTEIDLSGN